MFIDKSKSAIKKFQLNIENIVMIKYFQMNQISVCLEYDTKQSDGEALFLKLLGMWSTSSVPLLQGPLWPRGIKPFRIQSMGQIELFDF